MYENLKVEEKNFIKERVSIPNPNIVYEHILKLHKILRDDMHRLQFLPVLYNAVANTDNELETEEEEEEKTLDT